MIRVDLKIHGPFSLSHQGHTASYFDPNLFSKSALLWLELLHGHDKSEAMGQKDEKWLNGENFVF